MSNSIKNNLTKPKIQQLLAAVGTAPTEDNSHIEAEEHNWSVPHYFNNKQLAKLSEFTEQLAKAIAEKFVDSCRSQFEVTIASITQSFADEFVKKSTNEEQSVFYLVFGSNQNNQFGLLGIPEQAAVSWSKLLLGDTEAEENADRKLSELEKSLLLDLASAVIKAFSNLYTTCDLQPAGSIEYERFPLEFQGTEELCQISLNIKKTDTENNTTAYFLIPCSKLESVVGKTTKSKSETSPKDISKVILEHLEKTRIGVTVQLASVELSFEQMMDLQANDIVLLDKNVNEPLELVVEGRTVCYGWPAQSAGKYAVTISTTAFGNTA